MAQSSEFVDYLMELFKPMSGVSAKRMFGGYGLYKNGLMFGLLDDDELFLKVDDPLRPDYDARGLRRFTYQKKEKEMSLSYYQAPPECLDQSEILCDWALKSYEAALRQQAQKSKKTRKRTPRSI